MFERQTLRFGRKAQNPLIVVTNDARTGSSDEWTVPQNPLDKMNSVKVDTINTDDSARTSASAVSKVVDEMQSISWADFMASREAMLSPVILRLTLASPIMVKSLERDIAEKLRQFFPVTRLE